MNVPPPMPNLPFNTGMPNMGNTFGNFFNGGGNTPFFGNPGQNMSYFNGPPQNNTFFNGNPNTTYYGNPGVNNPAYTGTYNTYNYTDPNAYRTPGATGYPPPMPNMPNGPGMPNTLGGVGIPGVSTGDLIPAGNMSYAGGQLNRDVNGDGNIDMYMCIPGMGAMYNIRANLGSTGQIPGTQQQQQSQGVPNDALRQELLRYLASDPSASSALAQMAQTKDLNGDGQPEYLFLYTGATPTAYTKVTVNPTGTGVFDTAFKTSNGAVGGTFVYDTDTYTILGTDGADGYIFKITNSALTTAQQQPPVT